MEKNMIQAFAEVFDQEGEIVEFYSPGRVNLIGEHIDYNGGFVFPCALDFGTHAAVRLRDDKKVNFVTLNFDKKVTSEIGKIKYNEEDDWANYPKGVIAEFEKKGFELRGMDILYYGTIPNGSGLSSSASLEVLTGVVVNEMNQCGIDMVEIVKMSQRAENEFVGVNCGIMDQFAVGMGKKDHAILLNCDTLDFEYVPLKLEGVKIVIGNTKSRRGLADSKYNERRSECDEAVLALKEAIDFQYLCELDAETFEKNKSLIKNDVVQNRAEHAVYENIRTVEAQKALTSGDIKRFGELMNESHDSLRDLYEVTGEALDTMVEEARKIKGTIGSRMTGAGFGGCTVSLVEDAYVDQFIAEVGKNYEQRLGLKPEFYVANVGEGAGRRS